MSVKAGIGAGLKDAEFRRIQFAGTSGILLLSASFFAWRLGLMFRGDYAAFPGVLRSFLVLAGLGLWLLGRGSKSRRIWAFVGLSAAATLAAMPCWIPEFPAQDYPTPGSADHYLPDLLKRIQADEDRFHSEFHRYGNLVEIHAPTIALAPPGPWRPYKLTLTAGKDAFQLTAEPYRGETGYACCIGCPRQRYFFLDESGILRANGHCRAADGNSSIVK